MITVDPPAAPSAAAPHPDAGRSRVSLLVLNTDLPIFPGGGGVEYLTMTNLAATAGEVGLVSLAHSREDLERSRGLTEAGVRLYLWKSPWLDGAPVAPQGRGWGVLRAAHHLLVSGIDAARSKSGRPADTRIMDAVFANMAPSVIEALSERSWQVLAVVQSSAAAMVDHVPRPLVSVLVMHDIRARLYERRAEVAGSPLERWRLRREARRYHAFERRYCQRFDLVVTVSAEDARWVREQYRPRRVVPVPLPVDSNYFAPQPSELECAGRVIFTGLMSHPPNVDAACYFARDVFPRIRARVPSAEFHVIGRHPVEPVLALGRLPGVRVFPNVPDMRTHIAGAEVVVVPLRYGSGARQKILEAWSMEKCVVSTSIGAEGLEYEHGVNTFIADDTESLAESVTTALSDAGTRDLVRRGGRVVALTHHDPRRIARDYLRELEREVADKAAQAADMRVLLDLRWMIPGLAGGLEQLARAFIQQLTALDGRNQYTALVTAQGRYDLDLDRRPNFRTVAVDSTSAIMRKIRGRLMARVSAALRLPQWRTAHVDHLRWLRELGADIAYSFPGYIHPQLHGLRHVLMVPDIQHEYFPQFFSAAALEERRRLYTESAHRADHICAISEFTRQTLIHKLGVPPGKITTVLLAPDAMFTPQPRRPEDDRLVLDRHGLERGGYVFFPAHTWLHKNHSAAIDALQALRDRSGRTPMLVCTGGAREAQPALDARISAAGLHGSVRFLGYRPRAELPALYRGAACVLFPSLFEGFGMPVLEAMASGCPVVCSNTTSLPEIAGTAALLVDPEDPGALASALQSVLEDPAFRQDLIGRGISRAAQFTWRRHALETVAVFRRVHDRMRQS